MWQGRTFVRARETFRYWSGDLLFRQPSTLIFLWGTPLASLPAPLPMRHCGAFLSPANAWARDPGQPTVSLSSWTWMGVEWYNDGKRLQPVHRAKQSTWQHGLFAFVPQSSSGCSFFESWMFLFPLMMEAITCAQEKFCSALKLARILCLGFQWTIPGVKSFRVFGPSASWWFVLPTFRLLV